MVDEEGAAGSAEEAAAEVVGVAGGAGEEERWKRKRLDPRSIIRRKIVPFLWYSGFR